MLTLGNGFAVLVGPREEQSWLLSKWNGDLTTGTMYAHTRDPTSVFSTAACYEMPSGKYVSMPRGSKHRAPTDMKVDVLHLASSSLGSYCQWHQWDEHRQSICNPWAGQLGLSIHYFKNFLLPSFICLLPVSSLFTGLWCHSQWVRFIISIMNNCND